MERPKKQVILAVDDEGLHGSINLEDDTMELRIVSVSTETSTLEVVQQPAYAYENEPPKVEAQDAKWRKFMNAQNNDRRSLQELEAGSVDIHIHLDIDGHMKDTYGSAFAAARYAVELLAVISRDAYWDLGFNLKVVSINVRDGYLSQTSSTFAYLDELEKIPPPHNVNLLHSLTTRRIGGGVAYLGGLYGRSWCYGVSAGLDGQFSLWDRTVIAHELGHNFGADHTHEVQPPIDTCGFSCPSNPVGTIMSYCHTCSGGMGNIRFRWAPRIRDTIVQTYFSNRQALASRVSCNFISSQVPDSGVPFYLKGNECLSIDTTACTACAVQTCSLDSAFQVKGDQFVALQNENFCWEVSQSCDSVSLQPCSDALSQKLSFQDGTIVSQTCGQMEFSGSQVTAGGSGTAISEWCYPDSDDQVGGPVCDNEVIQIGCGETMTGNSANACSGEVKFEFVGESDFVTVSSCGSSYDTMLSISSNNQIIISGDDEGNCGYQTVLENVDVTSGATYRAFLTGYGGAIGDYSLSLTCSSDVLTTTTAPCSSETQTITCGDVKTGSTANACDAQQRFSFSGIAGPITVSTCGSNYDTMLSIASPSGVVASGDDDGNCGFQTILADVSVNADTAYAITVSGYNGVRGNYRLEMTCANPPTTTTQAETTTTTTSNPSQAPTRLTTLIPTGFPSARPTTTTKIPTSVPTSQPTSIPTTQPTNSPAVTPTEIETTSQAVEYEYRAVDGCSRSGGGSAGVRGGQQIGFYASTMSIAELTCCSMDGQTCSRKRSDTCRSGHNDNVKVTWEQARDHCAADGMRLCATQEEVDRCCGSGCWYDSDLVWTSISRVSQPTSYHYSICGKPSRCSGALLSEDSTIRAVRCVSDSRRQGWKSKNNCGQLSWESDIWGSCQNLNYQDAVDFCATQNARLPTLQEAESGCVAGSGCGFDGQQIWTSTAQ